MSLSAGPRGVRSLRHPICGCMSRGGLVPRIVAHHDVKDRAHWLASPLREQVFGPLGVHNIRTYTDPNNPVHVSLTADVDDDDIDAFGAFMQSDAAAEAMASDGVLPETVVVLIEA